MADETEDTQVITASKKRRNSGATKRRNFFKIVTDLEAYCQATIDVLESAPVTDFGKGQIAMANQVLRKVQGTK
jgi:hypothetical protein